MVHEHWESLQELILVAGHAVYTASNYANPQTDESWFLQSFQKGEPPFYIEHILTGVEIASAQRDALLIFSGGQTRAEAGPRSEAQSYWLLANHFGWWHRPSVRLRAVTEEFARDSFENLLFGLCRFRECTGHFPSRLTVIGWAFKQRRFELHHEAIKWPATNGRYNYMGVNNPIDLDGAMKGEAKAIGDFQNDPFGTELLLINKRLERDPFLRQHPYFHRSLLQHADCQQVTALLGHKTSAAMVFPGTLPW